MRTTLPLPFLLTMVFITLTACNAKQPIVESANSEYCVEVEPWIFRGTITISDDGDMLLNVVTKGRERQLLLLPCTEDLKTTTNKYYKQAISWGYKSLPVRIIGYYPKQRQLQGPSLFVFRYIEFIPKIDLMLPPE